MSARRAIIPVFVPHQGCPHNCVFCDQKQISGAGAPATVETVEKALVGAAAIPAPHGRELAFYGGSFTAIPAGEQEALLGAAFRAKQAGFLSGIRLSTRPDCVQAADIERLSRFGVTTVELGAQSMDDGVLCLSGRGHLAADTVRAARRVKAGGFQLILQMMTGLPGDSPEKSRATARALAALEPDGVRIYPTVVLRGTPLYDLWQAGRYRPQSVEEAVKLCAGLLDVFAARKIPVIRLGLNPSEVLSGGAVAAGAYHPALGELCRARQLRRQAEALLAGCGLKDPVLLVPPGQLSAMIGQKRENVTYLQEKFALHSLRVKAAPVETVILRKF